ncbi:hypothetical protein V495_08423, partial [Pseudogymnoascus sp. VKM F-4514 (FW-929)]
MKVSALILAVLAPAATLAAPSPDGEAMNSIAERATDYCIWGRVLMGRLFGGSWIMAIISANTTARKRRVDEDIEVVVLVNEQEGDLETSGVAYRHHAVNYKPPTKKDTTPTRCRLSFYEAEYNTGALLQAYCHQRCSRAAEADVREADGGPCEDGAESREGEHPVEDGVLLIAVGGVGDEAESGGEGDGDDGTAFAVDVAEDLGGLALVGEGREGA